MRTTGEVSECACVWGGGVFTNENDGRGVCDNRAIVRVSYPRTCPMMHRLVHGPITVTISAQ
jgi:hypothetical protein